MVVYGKCAAAAHPYGMRKEGTKYIFIVGGIMSGIGKGVSASSIGTILAHYGYAVNIMKIDPYLNVDAGTMNPTEHGEVFVLDSGLETDQDMGNYERFLNRDLSPHDYMTGGMVYRTVIERERTFKYAGKCVEAIPHVVDEIRARIENSANAAGSEVQIVEIGGTLGDYQNLLFLEAARQMDPDMRGGALFVLVSYLPCPSSIGEVKTRPTQHAIRNLNSYGINPSVVIARSEVAIDGKRREKIARACGIRGGNIIPAPDVASIYDVPVNFDRAHLGDVIIRELNLPKRKPRTILPRWRRISGNIRNNGKRTVRIGIVGKYFGTGSYTLSDAYVSVIEAVKFSSAHAGVRQEIDWIQAKDYEGRNAGTLLKKLEEYDGIIIPGGFGSRGTDGKMNVIRYAREHGIPILGICYGMQIMVIEYMRHVAKEPGMNSLEIDPKTEHDIITVMEHQKDILSEKRYGGSMRLGGYTANLRAGTLIRKLYGAAKVTERHRHRYEVNNAYIDMMTEHGLTVSAYSDAGLVEAVELQEKEHPFFVGVQYHPEFTARPFSPNPLFTGLVTAAKKRAANRGVTVKKGGASRGAAAKRKTANPVARKTASPSRKAGKKPS